MQELYDDNADIDAEEVLKLRMRRKSKRRKENPVTMDEILQQKQQEIKTLSPQQQSTDDETGEKDTKSGIEITGVSKDNDSTGQGQSRGVSSLHSLTTPTPIHVSVVNNNDKLTESESAQGHSDNTPLEEKKRFDGRHHIGREIDKNTMVLCENTQHAIETTAFMDGASVLPSNDQRSSKSSGVISQSTLSHSKDFTSSDSLNDQKNEESNINEDATSHQSQSAPTVTNDPIYDGSEIINEKIIVQRIMNEMSSHENYNNENISEEQITGNNDSPKTTNDNITRSSPDIDAFKGDELHESVFTEYISRCEQERGSKFLNFDSQTEETACLEGSCKSQSDSRPFSGERIFNNSSDVKSDKKSHISNVEQQPAIDEHLKFQGVAIIETTTTKERTIKTVDNSVEEDAGAKKNDNVSDEIKLSVNEKTKQTIAISLDADNLIVEKQYLAGETSQDSNSKIMETTYDNRNYNSKSEDNVPKKSYGNGFLVSADVHTSGGIPDKNRHGGDKNDNNKNSSNADQNESKLESKESRSSVRQQSVSTLSKSGSLSTSTSSVSCNFLKVKN